MPVLYPMPAQVRLRLELQDLRSEVPLLLLVPLLAKRPLPAPRQKPAVLAPAHLQQDQHRNRSPWHPCYSKEFDVGRILRHHKLSVYN